ncbi:zinc-binding dehydrogenase [Nocardia sp. CDC159]|uniref:Zinc-binding dehydrogenase n=1 Tax=Nocardia pulmonis TaxID=2951408 RepID=A0A9X2E3E8_9NOCA|nr:MULTISPECIES: zinc-binding dehydrogenase [Nocardia]MCM6773547.1 zinc-binding dehydrogenase [Nocardia pulmonis]MCM6786434.1 zinc-binding dehydrogenase [Nocardia sp. CDC159]
MRAVEVKSFGGPEVLAISEVPDPEPGPGEVVVDVAAADVMFLDTRLRSGWGLDFFPVEPPYVPGGAVAGVVSAVGPGVDPDWVGKRVATRTAASGIGGGLPIGGYAERALARADSLDELPTGLDFVRAAALVHDGRTALAVAQRAEPRAGEWVLITAAGGGLGTLLIQLARAAGSRVIAAARGAAKLDLARRLGANEVVDYDESGWADQVLELSGGDGVQVVLDGAGGRIGSDALGALSPGGRFLGYGNAAGGFAEFDTEAAAAQGITVVSLMDLTASVGDWPALGRRAQAEVAADRLEVVVGQTFPLGEAAAAHAAMEARTAVGRTILTV